MLAPIYINYVRPSVIIKIKLIDNKRTVLGTPLSPRFIKRKRNTLSNGFVYFLTSLNDAG